MEALSRGSIRVRSALKTSWGTLRDQARCYNTVHFAQHSPVKPVTTEHDQDYDSIKVAEFKALAFVPEQPLLLKARPSFLRSEKAMPAIRKWFDFMSDSTKGSVRGNLRRSEAGKVMSAYLNSFASTTILPFELAYPQADRLHGEGVQSFIENLRQYSGHKSMTDQVPGTTNAHSSANQADPLILAELLQHQLPSSSEIMNNGRILGRPKAYGLQRFLNFPAPLALLDAAIRFNLERPDAGLRKLYVAQAPLNDLPQELQGDLPVPKLVKYAGKGDIYSSSIWLGLEPTYTPLHRDPNPNLFIQLCGTKVVRLLPPTSGDRLFRHVQLKLGRNLHVNSRLRGPEMMDGPERDLMHSVVWDKDGLQDTQASQGTDVTSPESSSSKIQEAVLQPADALFIPKGWWHSVKSEDDAGRLNASVNWWFR